MGRGAGTVEDLVRRPARAFWEGRTVLLTGQTGFKGAWAARMLAALGARVTAVALDPEPGPGAYALLRAGRDLSQDLRADLAAPDALAGVTLPEGGVVLHMAAQPIVSEGFRDPVRTWSSNVAGTMTVLQALRGTRAAAAVIVTSDKVYRSPGPGRPYVEGDPLGGGDPYAASKAACEGLVACWRDAFDDLPPMATARAGNVIGGGDFGRDRLIPDLVRAEAAGQPLALRNPGATRPFQHVLDVVAGYLVLAEELTKGHAPEAVNFGPAEAEITVADLLCLWQEVTGRALPAEAPAQALPEAPRLALDSGLARAALGWAPRFDTRRAVADTARWYDLWRQGGDTAAATDAAIFEFLSEGTP
jgi:CDP-glucose 4,6-dehydratase